MAMEVGAHQEGGAVGTEVGHAGSSVAEKRSFPCQLFQIVVSQRPLCHWVDYPRKREIRHYGHGSQELAMP